MFDDLGLRKLDSMISNFYGKGLHVDDELRESDFWSIEKIYNIHIYEGRRLSVSGDITGSLRKEFEDYSKIVYGDMYDILKDHKPYDDRVAKLLIEYALRTNTGIDLPDCLQDEYVRRGGAL